MNTEDNRNDDCIGISPTPADIPSDSNQFEEILVIESDSEIEPTSPSSDGKLATGQVWSTAVDSPTCDGSSSPSDQHGLNSCSNSTSNRPQTEDGRKRSCGTKPPSSQDDGALPTDSVVNTLESTHLCSRCLAQFKSRREFEEHGAAQTCKKHSGSHFDCETCGRTYYKFKDLKVHTDIKHRYVCPKCSNTFQARRLLEGHVLQCKSPKKPSKRKPIESTEANGDVPEKKRKTDDMQEPSEFSESTSVSNHKKRTSRIDANQSRPAVLKLGQTSEPSRDMSKGAEGQSVSKPSKSSRRTSDDQLKDKPSRAKSVRLSRSSQESSQVSKPSSLPKKFKAPCQATRADQKSLEMIGAPAETKENAVLAKEKEPSQELPESAHDELNLKTNTGDSKEIPQTSPCEQSEHQQKQTEVPCPRNSTLRQDGPKPPPREPPSVSKDTLPDFYNLIPDFPAPRISPSPNANSARQSYDNSVQNSKTTSDYINTCGQPTINVTPSQGRVRSLAVSVRDPRLRSRSIQTAFAGEGGSFTRFQSPGVDFQYRSPRAHLPTKQTYHRPREHV